MTTAQFEKILRDTAYIRTGGSPEELQTAEYICALCREAGLEAKIEPFPVDMATMHTQRLVVDGREIPCLGYLCAGSGEVEAPLYYLTDTDPMSLAGCRGKIVLFDGYLGYWRYRDILDNGAVGFISYNGNVKDAAALIAADAATARITLAQDEYTGESRNVVLDLPGEVEETVIFTAHYDSTSLSQGAYDNMSGSIGLLSMAMHFAAHPHRRSLRFIWCGSEERGLLGAKAYCAANEAALEKASLCINLDMIGSTMGKFIACCTAEEPLVHYITYMGRELGFQVAPYQGVYSSDSTPFSDKGLPSVSFARSAPGETATIHNRYDTAASLKPAQLEKDIAFITAFADRMANAAFPPVKHTIPDNMKEKLDKYLCRKR